MPPPPPTRPGPLVSLLLLSAACIFNTGCASHVAYVGHRSAFLLTDGELDKATAGGSANLSLDLLAFAAGSTATTSTQGSIRTGQTDIMVVETPAASSSLAPVSRAKLLGVVPADLVFASGSATATGDVAASCSAQARIDGPVAFFTQASSMTLTPTTAACACGAFALSVPALIPK